MSDIGIRWGDVYLPQKYWVCLRSAQNGIQVMCIKCHYLPANLNFWIRISWVQIGVEFPNQVQVTFSRLLKNKVHMHLINSFNHARELSMQTFLVNELIQGILKFSMLAILFIPYFINPSRPVPMVLTSWNIWGFGYTSCWTNSLLWCLWNHNYIFPFLHSAYYSSLSVITCNKPYQNDTFESSKHQVNKDLGSTPHLVANIGG